MPAVVLRGMVKDFSGVRPFDVAPPPIFVKRRGPQILDPGPRHNLLMT